MTDAAQDSYGETIEGALATLEAKGYTADLHIEDPGRVTCLSCHAAHGPNDIHLDDLARLEGTSDPSDEVAVVAVRCPACAAKISAVLHYGPTASAEESAVLAALQDDRRRA